MTTTLLFDLDETLIVEEPAAVAAFQATAARARSEHELDSARLAVAARVRARELWRAAPTHAYCARVGISSWEGLWCRFEGDEPSMAALRTWSPTYRRDTWRLALADVGVRDDALAEELGVTFGVERRRRHQTFPDVVAVLTAARRSNRLGLVTNGASCLQREKLAASGLDEYFDDVVVSGDLGVAKPDLAVFRHALARLDADAARTTMIGDSIDRDIDGATAAGMSAVWLNRFGAPRPEGRPEIVEITSLDALLHAVGSKPPTGSA